MIIPTVDCEDVAVYMYIYFFGFDAIRQKAMNTFIFGKKSNSCALRLWIKRVVLADHLTVSLRGRWDGVR